MIFRNATNEDFDEIFALYRAAIGTEGCTWNENYPDEEILNEDLKRKDIFCLTENNEIIGSVAIDSDEEIDGLSLWSPQLLPCGEIARLVVKESHKNKGIARILLKSIMEKLKERGFKGAHFLVSKYHIRALRSYAKLGFNCVGEVKMFDVDWLCYEKEI